MISFEGINFLAVFVSAIVYFIIGFVWYSVLFGEIWGKETGTYGKEKPKPGALAGQFISTFLFALGIAVVLKLNGDTGAVGGVYAAALVTIFFAIPINSANLFFTGKKKLFLLDITERAIGSLVVGIIISVWQ